MKRAPKSQAVCWLEQTNPLRGMSIRDLQAVFDTARMGDTQRLHWIFQEIEALNPALLTCVERRASAVANFNWSVSERASQDGALSAEQRDALVTFISGITNFSDMLEHLDLAFFRGFAHAQPVWEADGSVKEVHLLDSWKFLRKDAEWFYNPACNGFTSDCTPCTNARLLTVRRRRPIDYPALGLHVRHAVGSRDWGRFLERYALPKPAVFMHPGATEDQKADYLEGAVAVENGQVSVWPAGASLTDFAGGSRGTDPFRSFIEHQEKQIILLATGGTLMSLAEAGTGTLAGNAQSDVWDSIVRRDSGVIAAAITHDLVHPFLAQAFPGQPVTVDFAFDFDVKPTPKEVLELNALAKQGGYTIAKDELEDAIGFTLVKDEPAPQPAGFGGTFLNKEPAPSSTRPLADEQPIPQNPAGHTEAAGQRSPGQAQGEGASNVLAAFAQDTGPAADAIRELLAEKDPEALKAKSSKLIASLPSLLPEDPALAAVIAEAMAAEFASKPSASADAVANKEGACTSPNGPAGCKSPTCPEKTGVESDEGTQADKRIIRKVKSSPTADAQAQACGYHNVKDMMTQAESVQQDTITKIQEGFSGNCKAHEAVAVISENKPFKDAEGNEVRFGDDILEHYIEGRRRLNNEPKVDNLTTLPFAIKAVKSDVYGVSRFKYPSRATPDPINPPKGTQREYHIKTGRGIMSVFVYIIGGNINGWHIKTKKPR